ncbi:MAG: hypothetical protein IKB72_05095 [Ruminococcus sp.]|nr:hypothetical protein [Ruminococcus sp.]
MEQAFSKWLDDNGLVKAFTTNAGDSFYVNREKKFGVVRNGAGYSVQSFYFEDVLGIRTYDDENLLCEWSLYMPTLRNMPKSNRYSTNEIKMRIQLDNGMELKIQIFRATHGNVVRESSTHVDLVNYAACITRLLYEYIRGIKR